MEARVRRLLASASLLLWAPASAALEFEYEILEASDRELRPGQNFGWQVAREPGIVLVGAQAAYEDDRRARTGAAYVFERLGEGWRETKLVPSDAAPRDLIGTSVAIHGDRVLVGSYHHSGFDLSAGAVWVFRRTAAGWVEEQKLIGSDVTAFGSFAFDMQVTGDQLLVGAYETDGAAGERTGAVHVFRHDGKDWVETQKLVPSDVEEYDRFGVGIGVSGEVAVIGSSAHWDDFHGLSRGVAYVFRFDGERWVEEARIEPDVFLAGYGGADTIGVSGDRVLLGVPHGRAASISPGYAVMLRFDGSRWLEEERLFASDGVAGDGFGHAVALDGDVALIAARTDNPDGSRGSVYLFRFDGERWTESGRLAVPDRYPLDFVGSQLRLRGGRATIGGDERVLLAQLFEPARVEVWPDREPDVLDPLSPRPVRLAVFGSAGLDVRDIVWSSLRFGPAGAPPLLDRETGSRDVDRDGFRDAVALFALRESGLAPGDVEVCVSGEVREGLPFRGCDAIETRLRCGRGLEAGVLIPALAGLGSGWRRRRRRRRLALSP